MSRADLARRLAERDGDPSGSAADGFQELKPRLPPWLFAKVLEQCNGQPSDQLMAWLETHQHTRDDIAQWGAEIQEPHWRDPQAVLTAGMSLADHPMRSYLGQMLSALVNRHAPDNLGYLPPEFINPSWERTS